MRYLMILLCCLLCSCSTVRSIIVPEEKLPLKLADPEPLNLADVTFIVIHKDNAEKVFADLEKKGIEPVVFALTGDDYKALASNTADIKSFLKLQRKIIILYREYYEGEKNGEN